jgi:hypothetical protein
MLIKTGSWLTKLPADHLRVGISRGTPRGQAAGYRRYTALNPGDWFKSSTIPDYLALYGELLGRLDPERVVRDLLELDPGKVPVLLCFESPGGIAEGACWCHRHLVAQWLEDRLGILVEEVAHPTLDRFAKLRAEGVKPPTYR